MLVFTLSVLFQLHTTSLNWTLGGLTMATWHSVNSRGLCIVCVRKWGEVVICRWSRSGRHTCFQIIRALGQLLRNIFWRVPVFLHLLRRLTAASSAESSKFRRDCRRFLEDLVSTILSTVAAPSPIGQGLSCFCPEIVIGGDDYSAFHLFGQLLDGLIELGWVRGSATGGNKQP